MTLLGCQVGGGCWDFTLSGSCPTVLSNTHGHDSIYVPGQFLTSPTLLLLSNLLQTRCLAEKGLPKTCRGDEQWVEASKPVAGLVRLTGSVCLPPGNE
jgi:hypothetical protein